MSSPPRPRSRNRGLYGWAIGTGTTGLLCAIGGVVLIVLAATGAERADARGEESEGYGFLALVAIFPCGAAVLLLIAALVLLIVAATRRA